jgi:hypothetical protein
MKSGYTLYEQLNIAVSGRMLWGYIMDNSGKCMSNRKSSRLTLEQYKNYAYKKFKDNFPAKLKNNCAACTVYIKEKDCYKRCKLCRECILYIDNKDSKSYAVIYFVSHAMCEQHSKWILEIVDLMAKELIRKV